MPELRYQFPSSARSPRRRLAGRPGSTRVDLGSPSGRTNPDSLLTTTDQCGDIITGDSASVNVPTHLPPTQEPEGTRRDLATNPPLIRLKRSLKYSGSRFPHRGLMRTCFWYQNQGVFCGPKHREGTEALPHLTELGFGSSGWLLKMIRDSCDCDSRRRSESFPKAGRRVGGWRWRTQMVLGQ